MLCWCKIATTFETVNNKQNNRLRGFLRLPIFMVNTNPLHIIIKPTASNKLMYVINLQKPMDNIFKSLQLVPTCPMKVSKRQVNCLALFVWYLIFKHFFSLSCALQKSTTTEKQRAIRGSWQLHELICYHVGGWIYNKSRAQYSSRDKHLRKALKNFVTERVLGVSSLTTKCGIKINIQLLSHFWRKFM